MANYYRIKLKNNQGKSFIIRDKDGNLMGLLTVGEFDKNEVTLLGSLQVSPKTVSSPGESKVW